MIAEGDTQSKKAEHPVGFFTLGVIPEAPKVLSGISTSLACQ